MGEDPLLPTAGPTASDRQLRHKQRRVWRGRLARVQAATEAAAVRRQPRAVSRGSGRRGTPPQQQHGGDGIKSQKLCSYKHHCRRIACAPGSTHEEQDVRRRAVGNKWWGSRLHSPAPLPRDTTRAPAHEPALACRQRRKEPLHVLQEATACEQRDQRGKQGRSARHEGCVPGTMPLAVLLPPPAAPPLAPTPHAARSSIATHRCSRSHHRGRIGIKPPKCASGAPTAARKSR